MANMDVLARVYNVHGWCGAGFVGDYLLVACRGGRAYGQLARLTLTWA